MDNLLCVTLFCLGTGIITADFPLNSARLARDISSNDGCSGTDVRTDRAGFIWTPGFGNKEPYPNDVTCSWRINRNPGELIEFAMLEMSIEEEVCLAPKPPNRHCCPYDHLTIYNGSSASSAGYQRLCGFQPPGDVITTGHSAFVRFSSDVSGQFRGFNMSYLVVDPSMPDMSRRLQPCETGVMELSQEEGMIATPGFAFGHNYLDDLMCMWRITAPRNKIIHLQSTAFHVESSGDGHCQMDMLVIYDGPDRSGHYRGSFCGHTNITIDSMTNQLFLAFHTDTMITEAGFLLHYSFINAIDSSNPAMPECKEGGVVLTASWGHISTPVLTGSHMYGADMDCRWVIEAPAGQKVILDVESFNLEPTYMGVWADYLEVFDGNSTQSPLIGKYSGTEMPGRLVSSKRSLLVRFVSDNSNQYPGFNATFRTMSEASNNMSPMCGMTLMDPIFTPGKVFAKRNAWPWHVRLLDVRDQPIHRCSGSLIATNWVLTAASCFIRGNDPSNYSIVAGDHSRDANDSTETVVEVAEIITHHKYVFDMDSSENDIALVRLQDSLPVTDHIKPVCLPTKDIEMNTMCTASGWEKGDASVRQVLQESSVATNYKEVCEEMYGLTVTDDMLCAEEENDQIPYHADAGGPLVCKDYRRMVFILEGVATPEGGPCRAALNQRAVIPHVYTKVSTYMMWIQTQSGIMAM